MNAYENKYTSIHATWTGTVDHKCNGCGLSFRSEHSAKFHACPQSRALELAPFPVLETEPEVPSTAMRDTPVHLNGPFTMTFSNSKHIIRGRDGTPICELSATLVDNSGRTEKYPDGFIRSFAARCEEAQFVVDAMNHACGRLR